ncbi:MAG: choline-sulfatase [Crocinitomix sp.]
MRIGLRFLSYQEINLKGQAMKLKKKPNFIFFMTDQQRSTQLFPEFPTEWIKENLPNYHYFLENGVVFDNNICNTSPCGPSRASFFTGSYPANNGIVDNDGTIPPGGMTFANVLSDQDYDVYYKGKMHLNEHTTKFSQSWTADTNIAPTIAQEENHRMEHLYGLKKWTSPDFGTLLAEENPSLAEIATLAGGAGHNDSRIITGEYKLYQEQESVISFLKDVQENPPERPFCLIISLVNPHDISLYPKGWEEAGYQSALFNGPAFDRITLPESYMDSLDTKPSTQATYLNTFAHGKLIEASTIEGSINYPLNYVKFYAYLHTLVDTLLGTVLDSMGKELIDNSVLIRMADHGEMGMSHGGLKEKNNNAYNETIRVPMIWVNPAFKAGKRDQMVSLIDLIPTMGALTGANIKRYDKLQGVDYSAALFKYNAKVQEAVLFNFTQMGPQLNGIAEKTANSAEPYAPSYLPNPNAPVANAPSSIYALVKKDWKYAVYYGFNEDKKVDWPSAQYELYNLKQDWKEMHNLLPINGDAASEALALQNSLHDELTQLMETRNIVMPDGWSNRC